MTREKWGVETAHGGDLMRSRLEARWATLIDTLGVRYEYEPKAIQTPVGGYLPDFYLVDFDLWVEIKPLQPDPGERQKLAALAKAVGRSAVLLSGFPVESSGGDDSCQWGGLGVVIATPDGHEAYLSVSEVLGHLDADRRQMAVSALDAASQIASSRGVWRQARRLVADVTVATSGVTVD